MSSSGLVLFCLYALSHAVERQNITLELRLDTIDGVKTLQCMNSTKFVLKEDVPIDVFIINSEYIQKYECRSVTKRIKLKRSTIYTREGSVRVLKDLLGDSETKFTCSFFYLQKDKDKLTQPVVWERSTRYTRVICEFEIAVKYWNSLELYINGYKQGNYTEAVSNDVDAQLAYYYEPNEFVKVKCQPPKQKGTLQFAYISFYNYSSTKGMFSDLEFQTVLKPANNKSYVDCKFVSNEIETVVRIYMILKSEEDENVIRVNNVVVNPFGSAFAYFYNGDLPTVTCDVFGTHATITTGKYNLRQASANSATEAVCQTDKKNTTIKLYKDVPSNGIDVIGLSDDKIMFQAYHKDYHNRIIYYEYIDNEVLEFNCEPGSWKLSDILEADGTLTSEHPNTFKRRMKKKYNLLNITCHKPPSQVTQITFHYFASPDAYLDETTQIPEIKDHISTDKYVIPITAAAAAFMILLLLLVGVFAFLKRRKQFLKYAPPPKEVNLTHNDPNALSAKRQDEVTYTNQPTRQIDEYASLGTSARSIAYNKKNGDLYSQPLPRNQRTRREDEVKYTEIEFDNNENRAQVVPKKEPVGSDCVYAEINQNNQDLYAYATSKISSAYDFRSNYANSGRREHAEPAYCEAYKK